ncbi:MAG: site-specific integrase [Bacteroidales bacterium]|nr:site-specific integrase [Bacteroidales bacterium]
MKYFNSNNSIPTPAEPVGGLLVKTPGSAEEVIEAFIRCLDAKNTTRLSYRKALRQFFRWTETTGRALDHLNRQDVLAYREFLFDEKAPHSELTVSLYMTAIRRFFEWTEGEKIYPNVAKDIKSPRKNKKAFKKMHLTDSQGAEYLDAFLSAETERRRAIADSQGLQHHERLSFRNLHRMSVRDYAMVSLMLYCGLRTIEVSRLNVGDITFKAGKRILMVQGKGHDAKDAYVILIDEAWRPVKEYLDTRPAAPASAPLFVCEGYGCEGRRISTKRIQTISKEGFRRIGLDGHEYSAHSLRHTTGVMIVKNGGGLLDVQTVLRHENPATSEIYIASAMEELRLQNAPESRLAGCFQRQNPSPFNG